MGPYSAILKIKKELINRTNVLNWKYVNFNILNNQNLLSKPKIKQMYNPWNSRYENFEMNQFLGNFYLHFRELVLTDLQFIFEDHEKIENDRILL